MVRRSTTPFSDSKLGKELKEKGEIPENKFESSGLANFVSGGGGGGGRSPAPTPTPKPLPMSIRGGVPTQTAVAIQRTNAQLVAERARQIRAIRQDATRRNIQIDTPVQQRQFLNRLQRESDTAQKRADDIRKRSGAGSPAAMIAGGGFAVPTKRVGLANKLKGLVRDLTSADLRDRTRNLERDVGNLNNRIGTFNKKFGGRELSPSEFNQANVEAAKLDVLANNLNLREKNLIKGLPEKQRKTFERAEKERQRTARAEKEGFIKTVQRGDFPTATLIGAQELVERSGILTLSEAITKQTFGRVPALRKLGVGEKLNPAERKAASKFLSEQVILAGASPVLSTSGQIVSKLPKTTTVKFVGKQRTVGNKIVTDVVFLDSGKRIGVAKGVTFVKKGKTFTVTAGKTAKRGVVTVSPSGKIRLAEREAFVGIEKSVAKARAFRLRQQLSVAASKFGVRQATRNLKGLIQASRGKLLQVRGDKVIRRSLLTRKPKKVKATDLEDFVSLAAIFSKKDLSLIVGRTLLKRGDQVKFIGLITGSGRLGATGFKITAKQTKLYNKALKQVLGTVSSTAKASKVKGLSPQAKAIISSGVVATSQVTRSKAAVKSKASAVSQPVKRPTLKLTPVAATKVKQIEKQSSKVAQQIKQIQKQRVKQKGKQKTKLTQKLNQLQRQLQKQKLQVKQIQKQRLIQRGKATPRVRPTPRTTPRLIPRPLKRKRRRKVGVAKKKQQAYNVFGRPLRKRKRGKKPKLIRLNKKPLSKQNAERLGSTAIDTSLARTFQVKATRGTPQKLGVRTTRFNKKKFRDFRIVKGRRKKLKNTFIERSRRLLDTSGERKGITLRRRMAQLRKRPTVKRKITSAQRKVLIQRLKKARAVKKKKK